MQPIQNLLLNPLTGINLVSISQLNDNFYMTAKCDTVSSYSDKKDRFVTTNINHNKSNF